MLKQSRTCIPVVILTMLLSFAAASAQVLDGSLAKSFQYREIGPTRQGGRYVDFAVPKGEPNVWYTATASGGLWKTVNRGITFESIFDVESVVSIGAVAVPETEPNTVWVGTGEGNNSRSVYWGDGIYKSVDAGKTWKNAGLKKTGHIGRIKVNPKDADVVYVAASYCDII